MPERKTLSEWEKRRAAHRAGVRQKQQALFIHVRSLFARRPLDFQTQADRELFMEFHGWEEEDIEAMRSFAGLVADHILEGLILKEESGD